ncbi:MAG TPA: T9SS type A sorting domain-containing protein [Bacteroidales bacterium]|nr:T9SS type A sorting domain-containing protein [Bacteroidales bacterium]
MKTSTLIIVGLFIPFVLFSQELVTISGENQIPQIGDTIYYVNLNDFGFELQGIGPVTAKVWDYSSLGENEELKFWYIDPDETGIIDSFPNATIAEVSDVVPGYMFYATGDYYLSRLGSMDQDMYMNYYSDSATLYSFPITAGDDQSYSYEGALEYISMSTWMDIVNGEINIEADAQGTLITPSGTFENVLRIHVIESFEAQVDLGLGTPTTVMTLEDDYYYWFHEDYKSPILIYGITDTQSLLKQKETTEVLRYQPIITTSLNTNQKKLNLTVYPNPASKNLNIISSIGSEITVYDILGNVVLSTKLIQNNLRIDVSNWKQGMYILKSNSGEKSDYIKIIVQ